MATGRIAASASLEPESSEASKLLTRMYEAKSAAEQRFKEQRKTEYEAAVAAPGERKHLSYRTQCPLLVEVKIAPVSIGDAIRQLKLYREYWRVEARRAGAEAGGFVTCQGNVLTDGGAPAGCRAPQR